MVRKLLKRKLKVVALKKLKTIKRTQTSLGEWAAKQLVNTQSRTCLIRYPKTKNTQFFLQEKHLLNQVIGNFSYLQTKQFSGQDTWHGLPWLTPHKVATANPRCLSQVSKPVKSNLLTKFTISAPLTLPTWGQEKVNGVLQLKNDFHNPKTITRWPLYTLHLKDALKQSNTQFTHWKNIYSLDQLMCHQYDAQFRRKVSPYKARLMESRKLTALYGKSSKNAMIKSMVTKFSKNLSKKPRNLPIVLESRLDVAIQRCFVFTTLRCAQHWISQGRILVNQSAVTTPSHLLHPGDVLTIGNKYRHLYKSTLLNAFYRHPKESKYVQSGKLLSRWKEWASLYNYWAPHHPRVAALRNPGASSAPFYDAGVARCVKNENKDLHTHLSSTATQHTNTRKDNHAVRLPKVMHWPDKGVKTFWYLSGRSPLTCLWNNEKFVPKTRASENHLMGWLSKQRWPRMAKKYAHWKTIYRRRILVFSRWLLGAKPLTRDGLYLLRWHRAFIRKKSYVIKTKLRQLSLQKPLHFEVSYKNFCAFYLYPPQRIVWPCMIDFRKIS